MSYSDRDHRSPRDDITLDSHVDDDREYDRDRLSTAPDNDGDIHMHEPVDTYIPPSALPLIDPSRRPYLPVAVVHADDDDGMDLDRALDDYKHQSGARIHDSPSPGAASRPITPPLRYTPPRSPRYHAMPAFAASRAVHGALAPHGRSNSMGYPPARPRSTFNNSLYGRPRANSDRRDYRDRDAHARGGSPSRTNPTRPPPKVNANPVVGVFGLSIRTTERDLEDEFGRFGEVDKVVITDRSRGFGFVTLRSTDDAARAVEKLNGSVLHGRTLRVDFSATQKAHAPTPGEYKGQPRPVDDRADARPPRGYRDGGDRYESRDRDRRDRDRYGDDRRSRDDRYGRSDRYDRYDDRERDRSRDRDYRRRDRDGDPYGGRSRRDRSPSPRRRYSRSPERKRAYSPAPRHEGYSNGNGHGHGYPAPPAQLQYAAVPPPAAAPGYAPPQQAYDPASAPLSAAAPGQQASAPAPVAQAPPAQY